MDDPERSLFIDLYEVTMAQAYLAEAMDEPSVFELFFRELPPHRNWMLACGLASVLDFLETFALSEADLDYLRSLGRFRPAALDRLRDLRFTGEVHAVPEGTVVFPDEPILQVIAPPVEAQLVETYLLNQCHVQTVLATKAARVVMAAAGRNVVDFAARRTAGVDAALKLARCSWIAGAAGTSNLLAGRRFGIPVLGTMAHSYVQAHDDEYEAFRRFASEFPETTLLVDTYDTLAGIDQVIRLARELGDRFRIRAVRLDSGDLGELARQARARLDAAGLAGVKIFVSGGLNEWKVAGLLAGGAPIDGFGVGTHMGVSEDAPTLDLAYKLVEYAGRGRMKTSSGKLILPGRKQVFRATADGVMTGDRLARFDEDQPGEPLLRPVMRDGRRLPDASPPLAEIREHAAAQLAALPDRLRRLDAAAERYPVTVSEPLRADRDRLLEKLD